MTWYSRLARRMFSAPFAGIAFLSLLSISVRPCSARAQEPTGSVGGRVIDDQGGPLVGAQVAIPGSTLGTQTGANGEYVLPRVPAGSHSLQARFSDTGPSRPAYR